MYFILPSTSFFSSPIFQSTQEKNKELDACFNYKERKKTEMEANHDFDGNLSVNSLNAIKINMINVQPLQAPLTGSPYKSRIATNFLLEPDTKCSGQFNSFPHLALQSLPKFTLKANQSILKPIKSLCKTNMKPKS